MEKMDDPNVIRKKENRKKKENKRRSRRKKADKRLKGLENELEKRPKLSSIAPEDA